MPWRELSLTSTIDFADGLPAAVDGDRGLVVFSTADLRWQPLVSDDPDGAQIAMLWGGPDERAFGAVVHLPKHPPGVYTLVRRSAREPRDLP